MVEKMTIGKGDVGTLDLTPRPKPQLTAEQQAERDEQVALQRNQHKRRIVVALDAGFTITGLRLSDPKNGHETGLVVTFGDDERGAVLKAIRGVVESRK